MISSMSDDFLDWLVQCPVQWILVHDDGKGNAVYNFIDDGDDEE